MQAVEQVGPGRMRFVIAKRRGKRGEGLGNECFSWAKGWIASQELDARLIGPAWGINARRYYRNFGTSRADVLLEEACLRLPHHEFTEADYWASGEIDFGRAIHRWASGKGLTRKKSFIVTVDGMYGGYPAIHAARPFLMAKLLNSRDALKNMYEVVATLDRTRLFVAVHIRSGGDFSNPRAEESVRAKFNIRIPDAWYMWVCEALQEEFQNRLQFVFFTDRGGPGFDEAVRRFNPGQIRQRGLTECSDLALMAQADLRICSVSSYSLVASFLSGGPYLWYEPQLNLRDDLYSLWSHEDTQKRPDSLSLTAASFVGGLHSSGTSDAVSAHPFLGSAMAIGDTLPRVLTNLLKEKLCILDPRTNLLDYGCVPRSR